jgi:hypothetical protein
MKFNTKKRFQKGNIFKEKLSGIKTLEIASD